MKNTLEHIGILGMKWGVRRARGPASSDHIQSRELKKKHVSELSNAEIQKITTRLQLEKSLKSLDVRQITRGEQLVRNMVTKFGPMVALHFIKKYVKARQEASGATVIDSKFIS